MIFCGSATRKVAAGKIAVTLKQYLGEGRYNSTVVVRKCGVFI